MPVTDRPAPSPPPPPSFNDSQRRVRAVPPRRPARGGVSGRSRIAHRSFSTVCSSRIPFCNSRSTVASTVWGRMCLWVDGGTPLRGPDGGERLSLAALHAITPLDSATPPGSALRIQKNGILRVTATVATPPTSVTSRRRAVRVARHASWNEAARVYSARTAQRPHQPCQRRGQRCRYTDRQLPQSFFHGNRGGLLRPTGWPTATSYALVGEGWA